MLHYLNTPIPYQQNPRASIFSHQQAKEILGWVATSDFNQIRQHYHNTNVKK